jgi:hypothetical protein
VILCREDFVGKVRAAFYMCLGSWSDAEQYDQELMLHVLVTDT